ncbi:MAG: hypothetical protein IJG65_06135 [Synergistaceae bacterium]|nr:hypothetical protein [Synergistaceae bacterium]
MSRKFLVPLEVLVVLLLVIYSCANASLVVQFHKADYYYVGEDAIATVSSIGGLQTHVYTTIGTLPPGCYLEQSGGSTANIKGTPTTAGTYSFTVNVRAKTLDYSSGKMGFADDYGSVQCEMTIRPARSSQDTGGNTGNNTDNNTNGNTDGNTGNNTNGNTGNNTGGNTQGIGSSGGGGGGCSSGLAVMGVMLAALLALRKSRR